MTSIHRGHGFQIQKSELDMIMANEKALKLTRAGYTENGYAGTLKSNAAVTAAWACHTTERYGLRWNLVMRRTPTPVASR